MFKDFATNISPRGKLLIILLFIILVFLSFTYWISGIIPTLILSAIIFVILFLTKSIWLSDDHGKNILRYASLGIVLLILAPYGFWNTYASAFINEFLKTYYPNISVPQNSPSALVLVFAFAVIFIVNYFMRDKSAMNNHSASIDKDFPEIGFKQKLIKVADCLNFEIRRIDNDTSWTDEDFTPLDAEVEIISNNKRKKKITDLLGAIKKNKTSKTFLVIGDPGVGKSVALRQLTKELLKEVKNTGKLPVYINLKEWQANKTWNEENPPTSQEFYDFIVKSLKEIPDIYVGRFIDDYFTKMYEHGRIFFIFDSFDEIPAIMDIDDSPWLIDKLSYLIFTFLNGAHDSRGLLSSRIFRKPTQSFQTSTILEIRPFSELKIEQSFKSQLSNYSENLAVELFSNRIDLIPVARNPFTAALMIRYIKDNDLRLPANKSEIYANYIDSRLKECEKRITEKSLTIIKIKSFCTDLSHKIFNTKGLGLEITIDELKKELSTYSPKEIDDIADILVYAKLCRKSSIEKRLSFVHRRFNEYFVVKYLIENDIAIDNENIAIDSRWRDSLVLYCEIATDSELKEIINFCWIEISILGTPDVVKNIKQLTRTIHCMRFLVDAFTQRKDLLLPIEQGLSWLIEKNINQDENLLLTKFSVEATGILTENNINECLILAFKKGNIWINEVSFKASRNLSDVNNNLNVKLRSYIQNMNRYLALKQRKEILFSLSFSKALYKTKLHFKLYLLDTLLIFLSLSLSIFLDYKNSIFLFLFFVLFFTDKNFIFNYILQQNRTSAMLFSIRIIIPLLAVLVLIPILFHVNIHEHLKNFMSIKFVKPEMKSTTNLNFENKSIIMTSIILVLIFPWIEVFFFNSLNKRLSKTFFFLIFCFGISLAIIFAVTRIMTLESIVFYLQIFILNASIILLCIYAIRYFSDKNLVKKNKKSLTVERSVSRREIQNLISQFRTAFGRLHFLKFLDNNSIKASGEWIDGKLPILENQSEKILLSKLEEKWLGFN
jgi:DNA polymerase III delta prime subunit